MKLSDKKYELVHWITFFWIMLFLVIFAIFLLFKMQIRRTQMKQTTERFQDTLEIYVDTIDASLDGIERYLYLSLESSQDMIRVENGKKDLHYFIARQNIHRTLMKILNVINLRNLLHFEW